MIELTNKKIIYSKMAWLDGKYLELEAITIPLNTYALHYGSSIYEGIRIYNGRGFKLKEHVERLMLSAKITMMEVDYSVAEICEVITQLIAENKLESGYIRPLIWRGAGDLLISSMNKSSIAIMMWGRIKEVDKNIHQKKPMNLTISEYIRYHELSYPVGAKVGGLYIVNTLAKYKASELGYDDALMLTHDRKVAEATTSNIFVVKSGEIYTPTTKNILNGITRLLVIDIARELGYKVNETDFDVEFLAEADEVFLTGTACEIDPVAKINEVSYKIGEVTEKIYNAFIKMIEEN